MGSNQSLSRTEITALWLLSAVCFVIVIAHFQPFKSKILNFGDNSAYLQAAHAIHDWDFRDVNVKQFWGLSYVLALFSFLPKISDIASLQSVCGVCSLTSVLLVYQLWGPWVAAYFIVLNFDWMQRSYLGGSEPLFVALLFGSFLYARKERWIAASALAALASIVRPVGVFALLAIGVVLLLRRDYRKVASCTVTGASIGLLYLLPFWVYFHDPLYQVHRYQASDWTSNAALSWPFHALALSFLHNGEPITNVLLTLGWIVFVLTGFLFMSRKSFRSYVNHRPTEFLFALLYLTFLLTYNSGWARAEFPRFAIPLVPFVLFAFEPWLPKSRVVLYPLCVASSVLSACSAIGIRNVFSGLR